MEPSSRSWSPRSIHHPLCRHHHPLCQRHHHHPHLLCSHHHQHHHHHHHHYHPHLLCSHQHPHQSSCPLHHLLDCPILCKQFAKYKTPIHNHHPIFPFPSELGKTFDNIIWAIVLQEPDCDALEEEEEEEDDPIFVLTDEWREFFARSEAKRKLGNLFLRHFLPGFALQAAQHPKPILSYPLVKDLNLDSITSKETSAPDAQVLQEPECDALEEEEEEEDDPIFVLTDEWREFFARSEAKRKLEAARQEKRETLDGIALIDIEQHDAREWAWEM
uniref:Uncharacterized protein n=1 Tax=Salix viminalis TaxID=40686 RepID=A0A6N2LD21_SALVM